MNRLLGRVAQGLLLGALGCGGTSIGEACEVNGDCDTGQVCLRDAPEGYCTKGCSLEGETNQCPDDSLCAHHESGLLCSKPCEDKGDCRDGYECNGVQSSEVKACRP